MRRYPPIDPQRELELGALTKGKLFAEAEALVGSATRRFADLLYGKHLLPAMMAGSCHQAFAAKRSDSSASTLPSIDCFPTIKLGVSALYEYVVNHRWPGTLELDLEPPYRSLRLLVEMRTEFDCEDYYWEPSLEEHDLPFERIRYLLEMTHARAKVEPDREALPLFVYQLEDNEEITVKELALLTGLSEGAVRNAASGTGPECFSTVRKGKIAIIEFDEAQRWLRYRIDNGLRCLYRPTKTLSKEAWEVAVAGRVPSRGVAPWV